MKTVLDDQEMMKALDQMKQHSIEERHHDDLALHMCMKGPTQLFFPTEYDDTWVRRSSSVCLALLVSHYFVLTMNSELEFVTCRCLLSYAWTVESPFTSP